MSERQRIEEARGLEELASAVADGEAVDWTEARDRLEGSERDLEALRTLEEVARTFRHAGEGENVEDGAASLPMWGHLRILEAVGEGSFGEVYRAHDPQLGRDVALKLRKRNRGEDHEWLGEAQRLARIRHENVLAVHGADRHEGREGIWTDWLDGQTLRERLDRDGVFGVAELVDVGASLSRALAAIHGEDMVHGDVKASNVMRERGGRLVLLDFGSGRELGGRGRERGTGSVQGSPLTTAPEVLQGDDPSPSSDIYSLCAMLYLLATGSQPFATNDRGELERLAASGAFVPLRDRRSDLPEAVIRVIESGLSPAPSERPTSAGDLERRLLRLQTSPGNRPQGAGSMPRLWAAAILVLALILAGGWWALRPSDVTPESDSPSAAIETSPASGPASAADSPATETSSEARRVGEARLVLAGPPDVSLETGARIRPGDRLALELSATDETYLYVINEDQAGDVFVLFPLVGVEPSNPLPAGKHRLPGTIDGVEQSWVVTSAGGSEAFLMVASAEPVETMEAFVGRHRPAGSVELPAPDASSPSPGPTVRGVGGLAPAPTARSELASLVDQLEALELPPWLHLVRLDNPR